MSFNVTPPKGGAFTPNKMLLMNRERRMNMLSPLHGEKLFNADIETGKVINEWGFQKDGVDVAMKVCRIFTKIDAPPHCVFPKRSSWFHVDLAAERTAC